MAIQKWLDIEWVQRICQQHLNACQCLGREQPLGVGRAALATHGTKISCRDWCAGLAILWRTMHCRYELRAEAPTQRAFRELRSLANWGEISEEQAREALRSSLAFACVYQDGQLVAMARLIGDGALFFYIQDVVVHPDFRGLGLGSMVMSSMEQSVQRLAAPGATVGLLAARGRESFYEKYGFTRRTGGPLGCGMSRFI